MRDNYNVKQLNPKKNPYISREERNKRMKTENISIFNKIKECENLYHKYVISVEEGKLDTFYAERVYNLIETRKKISILYNIALDIDKSDYIIWDFLKKYSSDELVQVNNSLFHFGNECFSIKTADDVTFNDLITAYKEGDSIRFCFDKYNRLVLTSEDIQKRYEQFVADFPIFEKEFNEKAEVVVESLYRELKFLYQQKLDDYTKETFERE